MNRRFEAALLGMAMVAVAAAGTAAPTPKAGRAPQPPQVQPTPAIIGYDIAVVDIGTNGDPWFCPVVTYQNVGQRTISQRLQIKIVTNGVLCCFDDTKANLAPGEIVVQGKEYRPHMRGFAMIGDVVEITIDPDNVLPETNKANNYMKKTITVKPLPRPPVLPTPTPGPAVRVRPR